jgi:phosphoribosylformylglycinamidine synthase
MSRIRLICAHFSSSCSGVGSSGGILAYHDRSDGGTLVAALEMAFAGRCGLDLELPDGGSDPLAMLFAEEAGALLQVKPPQPRPGK